MKAMSGFASDVSSSTSSYPHHIQRSLPSEASWPGDDDARWSSACDVSDDHLVARTAAARVVGARPARGSVVVCFGARTSIQRRSSPLTVDARSVCWPASTSDAPQPGDGMGGRDAGSSCAATPMAAPANRAMVASLSGSAAYA